MLKEIESVYSFCGGRIDFQDDTFTLDRNRLLTSVKRLFLLILGLIGIVIPGLT